MTACGPFDVLVVGNGVIGSSIAFELARRGVSVGRVGEPNRRYAASVASGAMLGCFGEVTSSLLATAHGRSKLAIDYEARGRWPEWAGALADASGDETPLLTSQGTLVILNTASSKAVDTRNFQQIESALKSYQEPYERVDPQEYAWLTPKDLHRALQGLFIPAEHSVDSSLLLAKLDAALRNSSGTVIDGTAQALVTHGDRATGVVLDDGAVVGGDNVIIAAGARSHDLLNAFPEVSRRVPPMVSGYGVSALVETADRSLPASVIRTPNRSFACGLHCVPRRDGVLYLGATNIISERPREFALLSDVKFLIECAIDQLMTSLDDASLLSLQVGNRPIPADGFPLLGKLEGTSNTWLATGTYRDGLHQSPLLARQVAGLLAGEAAHPALASFAPVRSPLAPSGRDEIICQAVDHMLGTGWEAKWNVSSEWPAMIGPRLRESYSAIAADLHPRFTPPAEVLVELDEALGEPLRSPLWQVLRDYYAEWE